MFDLAVLIAVVVALTQLAKVFIPVKYIPFLSLVLGVAVGILYIDGTIREQILTGVMIGLASSGLFDQSKIVTKKSDKS